MAWYIIEINSWSHLEQILNTFGGRVAPRSELYYRGQADADWGLTDSLTRLVGAETPIPVALKIEQEAREKFMEQAHLFLDPQILPAAQSVEGWWSLMQHFGAPTRLLDWTASPYVATYFAVADRWDKAGAIWFFSESDLRTYSLKIISERNRHLGGEAVTAALYFTVDSPEFVLPNRPRSYPNICMITQQGRFTLPGRILSDHGALIGTIIRGRGKRRNILRRQVR